MNGWIRIVAPLAGLAGVIVLFAILTGSPERYLSGANLRVVLAQTVIVAIGAIGMTMIIVSGGIDLSVGAVIPLSSVVTALALRDGLMPIASLSAGISTGGILRLLNVTAPPT